MVDLDGLDALVQPGEGMAVGGQGDGDALQVVHPVERGEELRQRVGGGAHPGDVGRDGGQDVVAREQDALGGVEQAEVIVGVAGRVDGDPVPSGEADHVGVVEVDGRLRRGHERPQLPQVRHARLGAPFVAVALLVPRCRPRRTCPQRRSTSTSAGSAGSHQVLNERWPTTSAPVSSRNRPAPPKWSGWLWVTIDGVDPGQREAGLGQPRRQGAVGVRAGQTGVDEGDAAFVLQGVAVDVAEAGHGDRQLQAQHTRADLGDLLGGRLLLLAHRRAHPRQGTCALQVIATRAAVPARKGT